MEKIRFYNSFIKYITMIFGQEHGLIKKKPNNCFNLIFSLS